MGRALAAKLLAATRVQSFALHSKGIFAFISFSRTLASILLRTAMRLSPESHYVD